MVNKRDESIGNQSGSAGSAGTPGATERTGGFGSTQNAQAMDDAARRLEQEQNKASAIVDKAKAAAGDAYDTVAEKAASTLEERKADLSGGLSSVAESVRRFSGTINQETHNVVTDRAAQYTETAAQKIEDIARYFERSDLKAMAHDLQSYARRNPAVFLGSAFALGVIAARFLKSSPSPTASTGQFATDIDHQLPAAARQPSKPSTTQRGPGLGATPGNI